MLSFLHLAKRAMNSRVFLILPFIAVLAAPAPAQQSSPDTRQPSDAPKSGPPPELLVSKAYRREALKLLVHEANAVAEALRLDEDLPITETNFVSAYITPPYYARELQAVGTVTARHHCYYISRGYKFSGVARLGQEADFQKWLKEYSWPIRLVDTNAAYQVATQWLAALQVDVAGLNRDYKVKVIPCGVRHVGLKKRFTPVYWVVWLREAGTGGGVQVQLFAPTRTLMQLDVSEPRYVLRPALRLPSE
jgi:hypothetical protein